MSNLSPELQQEVERIFKLQQLHRQKMVCSSYQSRKVRLKKLEQWIVANQHQIEQALFKDFHKPAEETQLTEIFIALSEIRHTLRHLKQWMKPKRVKPTRALLTTSAWVQYAPRGLALIISPWNFPFHLTVVPLASAIAAGNCVILKPSEFVPHTTQLLKQMVEELFPPQEVAIFLGDYTVAQALLEKPFDHIFFTGSTRVGKLVMAAAARHLSSVTLELGGKSPVVIDGTANLKDAAQKVAFNKYLNSGQTCIAPDYLLVHQQVSAPFNRLLAEEIQKMFGDNATKQKLASYARVINHHHFQRLAKGLTETLKNDGQLLFGGELDPEQNFISPTAIKLSTHDGALMQEEIFGPILPVITFNSIQEAITLINRFDKPLGLYIFSKDKNFIQTLIAQTDSGGVCINDALLQYIHLNLPFGGLRGSGFGNAHGFYGFRAFSYERAILRQGWVSPLKWVFPPYTNFKRKLIRLIIKYFT